MKRNVRLATQVFEVIEHAENLQIDETTFQLTGLVYHVFKVGAKLYVDADHYLDQAPLRILTIQTYGHFMEQIDRGMTCLMTVSLSSEAIAQGVMRFPRHLYRLKSVSSVPRLTEEQMTFIPPHLASWA